MNARPSLAFSCSCFSGLDFSLSLRGSLNVGGVSRLDTRLDISQGLEDSLTRRLPRHRRYPPHGVHTRNRASVNSVLLLVLCLVTVSFRLGWPRSIDRYCPLASWYEDRREVDAATAELYSLALTVAAAAHPRRVSLGSGRLGRMRGTSRRRSGGVPCMCAVS